MEQVALDGEHAAHAVEVAPRVWWVGRVLVDDPFQCHAYVIEAGRHSVLVDPGSTLTIDDTLRKVQEVVPLDHIEWILLHHSDPDIADALHVLSERLPRHDVQVITEWRAALLLKHFAARFPFATVEDLGWSLDLDGGRRLDFLLTPYLHFPGAFVTFDQQTRSLFSSDLFGGFNRARRLWAESADDFEDLRQFHEHYMPSREILMAGLATIVARFPMIDQVLPQHGYCIAGELVSAMFEQLGRLECGVMLASQSDTHLARLLAEASCVRRIEQVLEQTLPLGEAMARVGAELRTILPMHEFWVEVGTPPHIVRFDQVHPDGLDQERQSEPTATVQVLHLHDEPHEPHVAVVMRVDEDWIIGAEMRALLGMIASRVHHVADEALERRAVNERERALVAAAHSDPLTGLRNRRALDALVAVPVNAAVLMIDVDHFKRVNDQFGHSVGDVVLQRVADALTSSIRRTDTAIRYGGEEFVAVVQLEEDVPAATAAADIAERVRDAVADLDLSSIGIEQPITVSVGAAVIDGDESLHEHVRRADAALYTAKRDGRDRAVLFDHRLG